MEKQRGVILAITNQKGGVGKSVSSTNLAVAFAKKGKRTLLIDADYQGNASTQIAIKRDAVLEQKTISKGLLDEVPIQKLWMKTKFDNLFAIAADMELCEFNSRQIGKADDKYLFREWVSEAKEHFDIIVVDTHPSLDLTFQNIIVAADFYIIPLFAEVESLEGLHIMFRHMKVIKDRLNRDLHCLGCFVTKYTGKGTHLRFLDRIRKFGKKFRMPVIGVIPNSSAFASASETQVPVVVKKNLAVAKAYEKLASELMKKLKPRGKGRIPETPNISKKNIELVTGLVEQESNILGEVEEELEFDGI